MKGTKLESLLEYNTGRILYEDRIPLVIKIWRSVLISQDQNTIGPIVLMIGRRLMRRSAGEYGMWL